MAFATDVERIQGWQIKLNFARLPQRLAYNIEFVLFRTVQTLVDYAANHARAAHFEVAAELKNHRLHLRYLDDGNWSRSQLSVLSALDETLKESGGHLKGHLTEDQALSVAVEIGVDLDISLTPREREVMQQLAAGLTNKQIASQLNLSVRTVNFHLDNVYSKLNVNTRTEAVLIAIQRGWIENPAK